MRELFERLREGGETAVQALHAERMEEDLYLDFKRKGTPAHGNFSGDDKRIFAKALSGFSNSDGGLLVFGVDCRTGADGVDCVQGLEPVAEIERFASEARNMVASLLSPRNNAIEIHPVTSDVDAGAGYLLVWVPRSEQRPHQSRAAGEFKYYKRNGRDFHAMEHYEVEDAFRTQSAPELCLEFNERGHTASGSRREQVVAVRLRNISRNIAKFPYLQIDCLRGLSFHFSHINPSNLLLESDRGLVKLFAGQDFVIHPGQSRIMAQVFCTVDRIDNIWLSNGHPLASAEISFGYTFGCEGAPARDGRCDVPMLAMLS
ncbi:AlbA family DNA-binding domain-containing protein [Methylorubrum populi]|uniref:Schlafen AlbA-2 domain-containing protein n=1 Tax=Methylorubrum populi TaxID=223967 RepID=A0A833J070_9HYPH|nr:ATP-binding protein [Methylorubrum populi]KAB7782148.1 hypothetical protein F8B43_4903 [Methylorubrum populi]